MNHSTNVAFTHPLNHIHINHINHLAGCERVTHREHLAPALLQLPEVPAPLRAVGGDAAPGIERHANRRVHVAHVAGRLGALHDAAAAAGLVRRRERRQIGARVGAARADARAAEVRQLGDADRIVAQRNEAVRRGNAWNFAHGGRSVVDHADLFWNDRARHDGTMEQ